MNTIFECGDEPKRVRVDKSCVKPLGAGYFSITTDEELEVGGLYCNWNCGLDCKYEYYNDMDGHGRAPVGYYTGEKFMPTKIYIGKKEGNTFYGLVIDNPTADKTVDGSFSEGSNLLQLYGCKNVNAVDALDKGYPCRSCPWSKAWDGGIKNEC